MIQNNKGIFVFALSLVLAIQPTRAVQPVEISQESIERTKYMIQSLKEQLSRPRNSLAVELVESDLEDKQNLCLLLVIKSIFFIKTHQAELNNQETQANTCAQFRNIVQESLALNTNSADQWISQQYIAFLRQEIQGLQQYLTTTAFDQLVHTSSSLLIF